MPSQAASARMRRTGVRGARVLTWQERLGTLRDVGRWEHALALALQLLEAARVRPGSPHVP